MKNQLCFLGFIILAFGCNQPGSPSKTIDPADTSTKEVAVIPRDATLQEPGIRDYTITAENAYNNLFLDSSTVETYIETNKLATDEAAILRNFYIRRNFEYAWFDGTGLTAEALNFWNAYMYSGLTKQKSTTKDKRLAAQMDTMLNSTDTSSGQTDSAYLHNEIALTQKFIDYYGSSDNKQLISQIPLGLLLPSKKMDALSLADSFMHVTPNAGTTGTPVNPYYLLQNKLAAYMSQAKTGSWDTITIKGTLRKGNASPAVKAFKRRLQLTGDLPGSDTTAKFNDSLEMAVKALQEGMGLKPDGIITSSLLNELNRPPAYRLRELLVNMSRMLWLPAQLPASYIQVNIPEFLLKVYEPTGKVFDMRVVTGDEGTRTTMFAGDLNEVVFSPYWNLPASIVAREIMPAIKRNPNYLARKHMEIVGRNGTTPTIRQLPGPWNALGKVKFLFPNSYHIYLHDTPNKSLFNAKNRAFSHGCIRLEEPEKMANYVLRTDSTTWTAEKIHAAMNNDKEQFVKLKQSLPVIITYFTAWVDEAGKLNFRDDVYGHDHRMIEKLFVN
ncbi:MAG: L,D-transpeptidase family protein [Chitinophagaceae bacterium]